MAAMAFSTDANAVIMTTGSSSSSFFSSSSRAMPFMPGSITSTIAASKGTVRASSRPACAWSARRTA